MGGLGACKRKSAVVRGRTNTRTYSIRNMLSTIMSPSATCDNFVYTIQDITFFFLFALPLLILSLAFLAVYQNNFSDFFLPLSENWVPSCLLSFSIAFSHFRLASTNSFIINEHFSTDFDCKLCVGVCACVCVSCDDLCAFAIYAGDDADAI